MIKAQRPIRFSQWIAALSTLLLGSLCCSTYRPYQPGPHATALFTIGEWLNFVGYELTFYENGLVVYLEGGPKDRTSYLHPEELSKLKAFINSKMFLTALDALRKRGYQPGCCDMHDVGFTFRGESFGYPLWQPTCRERMVDEPVARFIDLVNELGGRHFRALRRNPLPKITCD